jgi:hypothetical protein
LDRLLARVWPKKQRGAPRGADAGRYRRHHCYKTHNGDSGESAYPEAADDAPCFAADGKCRIVGQNPNQYRIGLIKPSNG